MTRRATQECRSAEENRGENLAKIAIIGLGRVGTALGVALVRAGHDVVSAFDVDPRARERFARAVTTSIAERLEDSLTDPEVVLIAIPDSAVEGVSREISASAKLKGDVSVGHTSGALGSEVLRDLKSRGCPTFSMHPIQTFSSIDSGVNAIPGSYFGIEGHPAAVRVVVEIVTSIGGKPVFINSGTKALYHAALSAASNFLVTLLDQAVGLCEAAGIEREKALKVMLPLVRTTLANFEESGAGALTGPIERGEGDTLKRHVEAIAELKPDLLSTYLALARATVVTAREKGSITEKQARVFLKTLQSVDNRAPQV